MKTRALALAALLALAFAEGRLAQADDPKPDGAPPAPETKPAERGYLGFSPVPATLVPEDVLKEMKATAGLVVMRVFPGGPAAKAGLKVGDVLKKIGGQDVPDASGIDPKVPATIMKFQAEFAKLAEATMKVGAKVVLVVERAGTPVTLEAVAVTKDAMDALAEAAEDEEDEGDEAKEAKKAPGEAKPAAPMAPGAGAAPAPAAPAQTRGFVGFAAAPAAAVSPKWKEQWKVTADHGVVILHVTKGSPAEKAGLKLGDLLESYAGVPVPTDADLAAAKDDAENLVAEALLKISVAAVKPGGEVAIVVVRDGKPVTLKATAIGEADMKKVAAAAGEDDDDEEGEEEDEAKEAKEGAEKKAGPAMEPEKGVNSVAATRSLVALAAVFAAGLALTGCAGRRCCRSCVPCAPDTVPAGRSAPVAAAPAERQVFIDLVVVRVPEDAVSAALSPLGAATKTARTLGDGEAEDLLRLWRTTAGVETLVAPTILARDGQEATVFQGEVFAPTTPGAKGLTFSLEGVEPGENWAGISIRVKPVVSADGRFVSIDVRSAMRVLSPTAVAGAPATTTDAGRAPTTQGVSARQSVTFPVAGGGAVFVAPTPLDGPTQRSLVATLVRARVLEPEKAPR